MTDSYLQTSIDRRGVATLCLNRPKLHNAFDDQLIAEMTATLGRLGEDPQVRLVLLSATGKSFSAGADLNWMRRMADYSREENLADAQALAELMRRLNELPQPTIALVQGPAIGGGVGLVAACDIVIASEQARFCLSEVKLGLIPAVISPYVIAAIGARQARRYFLSAELFDAAEALRIGLAHRLCPAAELTEHGDRLCRQLLQNGPLALSAAKQLIAEVAERPIDEALIHMTAERIASIRATEEGREGLNAFLDKRKPSWVKE